MSIELLEHTLLAEYAVSGGPGLRVDHQQGVIFGARLIGLESKNGREYPLPVLQRAIPLYESAKVFVNHDERATIRRYQDQLGHIAGVTSDSGGLRGNLYCNIKHPVWEQLAYDAQHDPGNVGLSHVIEAETSRRGGKLVVVEILVVRSLDVVVSPATAGGLHESVDAESQRRALVETVARKIGLAPEYIPWKTCMWIREETLREFLLDHKTVLGRCQRRQRIDFFDPACDPHATEDFVAGITGGATFAEQEEFSEAMGLPSRNGKVRDFVNRIT